MSFDSSACPCNCGNCNVCGMFGKAPEIVRAKKEPDKAEPRQTTLVDDVADQNKR